MEMFHVEREPDCWVVLWYLCRGHKRGKFDVTQPQVEKRLRTKILSHLKPSLMPP